jgi:DNA-binding MarR family transcriptional regulator
MNEINEIDKKLKEEKESLKEKLAEELIRGRKKYISEVYKELIERKKEIYSKEIEEKAQEILKNSDPLYFICKTIENVHKGDYHLIPLNYCIGLSPWVQGKPLHSYAVGQTGKGKSDIISKTLLVFPKETYCILTSLSPKSPYYAYKEGRLKERQIIFFDDVKVDEEGIDTLKAFTSSELIKPVLWSVDKNRQFLEVFVDGTYSIFLTSVNPLRDPQIKSRFIIQNPDETCEQDARVWEYQDSILRKSSEENRIKEDSDFEVARCITQILTSEIDDIVIPFNLVWPDKKDRRLYPFFIQLLKTIAKVYKFQRKRIDGKIVATKADFILAAAIWERIKAYQSTKSNQNAQKVLEALENITEKEDALTYVEISQRTKLSTTSVKTAVYDLEAMGLVNTEIINRKKYIWLSVSTVQNRLFTNKTDNSVACDGFDLSVLPSWGSYTYNEEELKSYINMLVPETMRRFIENQQQEDTTNCLKQQKTEKDGQNNVWKDERN